VRGPDSRNEHSGSTPEAPNRPCGTARTPSLWLLLLVLGLLLGCLLCRLLDLNLGSTSRAQALLLADASGSKDGRTAHPSVSKRVLEYACTATTARFRHLQHQPWRNPQATREPGGIPAVP